MPLKTCHFKSPSISTLIPNFTVLYSFLKQHQHACIKMWGILRSSDSHVSKFTKISFEQWTLDMCSFSKLSCSWFWCLLKLEKPPLENTLDLSHSVSELRRTRQMQTILASQDNVSRPGTVASKWHYVRYAETHIYLNPTESASVF